MRQAMILWCYLWTLSKVLEVVRANLRKKEKSKRSEKARKKEQKEKNIFVVEALRSIV